MIKVIKFMEKMWLMLSIVTFIIGLYWAIKGFAYDSLYFFGFSVIAVLLFMLRRRQRKAHERNNSADK